MRKIPFIDSHTGGEPTRLLDCPIDPPGNPFERLDFIRQEYDNFRREALLEPRGWDAMVGAMILKPVNPACDLSVIFFNNIGYLGMCGHGMIGLLATLSYRDVIRPGKYLIETPVGEVETELLTSHSEFYPNRVAVRNVPAYRFQKKVPLEVDGRLLHGDIAWGGNWFFLISDHGIDLELKNIADLSLFCNEVRKSLNQSGIRGYNEAEIDHIELFSPSKVADSRNFVLCPGGAYDRSPCGTGTSAKMACLFAEGELSLGQTWRQESITGSVFEGKLEQSEGTLIPIITGEAWVMAEGVLIFDEREGG